MQQHSHLERYDERTRSPIETRGVSRRVKRKNEVNEGKEGCEFAPEITG